MRSHLIVPMIILMFASTTLAEPQGEIVNFNWLGIGYDLVYLDPENYAAPAFQGSKLPPKVFTLERMEPEVMGNTTYMIPKGVRLFPGSTQSAFDSEAKEIKSGNDYRDEMQATLTLSGGMEGLFSVSGSASFKKVREETRNSEKRIWRVKGERETHWLMLDLDSPTELTLSPEFRQAVQHLGDSLSYKDFIDTWGTHFSSTIVYGGKAYFKLELTRDFVRNLHLREAQFRTAVEGTFKKVKAAAEGSRSDGEKKETTEESLFQSIRTVAYGGDGSVIENNIGAYNDWAKSVRDNPTVLKLKLTKYPELLTSTFFPTDRNIADKKKSLEKAISDYLADNVVEAPATGDFYPKFQCRESDSIMSWWDGSTTGSRALDVLNKNDGKLNGVVPEILPDRDVVFNFEPGKKSNSHIRVEHSEFFTQLAQAKKGYTVSLWILWDSVRNDGAVLLLKGNSKKEATFALYIDSDASGKKILKFTQNVKFHRKRWCHGAGGDNCAKDDSGYRVYTVEKDITERLTPGKWMHIAATFDNTWHQETMIICVNGDCTERKDPKRQGRYDCGIFGSYECQEWAIYAAVDYPKKPLFIGMDPGGREQFHGKMDDIQIFFENLEELDITTMYEIGRDEDFFCK